MPALATAMVTGPSARSAAAKKACTDFSSRTSTAPANTRSPPSSAATRLRRVLAHVAQRHAAAGGVERLRDALPDAGARARHDDHGVAEVEAAHARCFSCHRATSSQVVNQTPL